MNREEVYSALWTRLASVDGFVVKSRRLLHWNDVPKQDQPALFMALGNQTALTSTGESSKWVLRADVYIYVNNEDTPSENLNRLLDAVCNTINEIHPVTGRSQVQASSCHVEYCRVEGTIETDEGTLGNQAVAIIPISILVAH